MTSAGKKWKAAMAKKSQMTPAASSVALVKAVAKKVVEDQLEDKYVGYTIPTSGTAGYPVYFNAAISSTSEVYPILPPLFSGVSSYQRVGDRIKPKRLMLEVVITANGALTSSQLNMVRLFILQDKSIKDSNNLKAVTAIQPGTPIASQLLNTGGGTQGFTGVPNTILMRVNTERYSVIKDKVVEVRAGNGTTPQLANGFVGTQVFVGTQQSYHFKFKIPTPKVLKYSGFNSQWPTNFAPFFCLGYIQPDGNASPDNLITRVAVNWWSHMDFEDA